MSDTPRSGHVLASRALTNKRHNRSIALASTMLIVAALLLVACGSSSGSSSSHGTTTSSRTTVSRWGVVGNKGAITQLQLDRPTAIAGIRGKVVQIATSNSDGYALTSTGAVYGWGVNSYGELGDGQKTPYETRAVHVEFPSGVTIKSLANPMPFDAGLAIDSSGHAWGWGLNGLDDLCLSGLINARPEQLPLTDVTLATGARTHALFDSKGALLACGSGDAGELGNGSTASSSTPTPVVGFPAGGKVIALTSSWEGSGALLANGDYYDWGYNAAGQLGNGTAADSAVPVKVDLPGPVRQVFQGGQTVEHHRQQPVALLGGEGAVHAHRRHQLHQVRAVDVASGGTGILGPTQHALAGVPDPVSRRRLEVGVLLERLVQLVQERALGPSVVHVGAQPRFQGGPRLEVGQAPLGRADQYVDVVAVDGLDDVDPLGEVAVQRSDAHPGLLGDGLHRGAAALVGEHLAGRHDEVVVVAPGIRPHGPAGPFLVDARFELATHGPGTPPLKNVLAKRRHPPYTNRRKLPLSPQDTSGKAVVNGLNTQIQQVPSGWRRHPSVVLAVILTAQLMVVLDATIVNVALPHIQRSLHFSNSSLSWVLNAYVLTFGGLLLLGARSGDLLGRRRTFMAGIALFSLSSLAGGFATTSCHAVGRPRPAGGGRRPGRAGRAGPAHDLLPRGGGEGEGDRPVHDRLGGGRCLGPGGRRPAHRVGVLALGDVRQRPDRAGRALRRRAVLVETARRHGRFDLTGAITSTAG
jgi:hypothetical protein